MTNALDLSSARSSANTVASIAHAHGWELPDQYLTATAIRSEATRLKAAGTPQAPMPATAKNVEKWVTAETTRRTTQRDREAVLDDLSTTVEREGLRNLIASIPAFNARLVDVFAKHVETFTKLVDSAPHTPHGRSTPDELAAHSELLRVVEDLTATASHRAQLAVAAGEWADIGQATLWLVIHGADTASIFTVREAVSTFAGRLPTSIPEWHHLIPFGLSLARTEEAPARMERFGRAGYASAMAFDDQGRLDRTIGEALARADAAPSRTLTGISQ